MHEDGDYGFVSSIAENVNCLKPVSGEEKKLKQK